MANKKHQNKPKTFLAGRLVFATVSVTVGAFGTLGWWLGDGEVWQRLPLAALAASAAFVVPVCAGMLGRSRASWAMLLPALVFAAWSAVSVEHGWQTLVERPREAAYVQSQGSVLAAVVAAERRVTDLQAKRDNLQPEVVQCPAHMTCRQSKAEAAARDTDKRSVLDRDIQAAKDEVKTRKAAIAAYQHLAPWQAVLVFGSVLDLVIALGLWAIESTARKELRDYEAKRSAEQKAKKKTKTKAVAKPIGDGTVTAAEELVTMREKFVPPELKIGRASCRERVSSPV